MKRQGVALRVLRDGDPRRLSDGRNAWRKMNDEQRIAFLKFIKEEGVPEVARVTFPRKRKGGA